MFKSRKQKHIDYLFDTINTLRAEIINDVLKASRVGEGPDAEMLRHKGALIQKYSRRLRLIRY